MTSLACFYFCVPFSTRPRPKWSELLGIFFAPRRTIWSKWMQSMTPIQTSYRIFIQLFRTESRWISSCRDWSTQSTQSTQHIWGFQWFVPYLRELRIRATFATVGILGGFFQRLQRVRAWWMLHSRKTLNMKSSFQDIGQFGIIWHIATVCRTLRWFSTHVILYLVSYNPIVCIHNYTHTVTYTHTYYILHHITHYITHDFLHLQSPTYFHLAFCPSWDARYQDWWSMGWRHHRAIGILIGSPYNMHKGKEERGSDVF